MILSTPYMDEAARCHRVGFMRGGRMIAEGTPSQLRSTLDGCILEVRGHVTALPAAGGGQDQGRGGCARFRRQAPPAGRSPDRQML